MFAQPFGGTKVGRFTTIPDHMYQEFGMDGGLGLD
jgi:hypothetical protein